jgi:hypothetical protein
MAKVLIKKPGFAEITWFLGYRNSFLEPVSFVLSKNDSVIKTQFPIPYSQLPNQSFSTSDFS